MLTKMLTLFRPQILDAFFFEIMMLVHFLLFFTQDHKNIIILFRAAFGPKNDHEQIMIFGPIDSEIFKKS